MKLFRLTRWDSATDYIFSVEISASVISRINGSVISSDIEEGGKFLGRVIQQGKNILFDVQTYLDSGPRVSNSETHLVPDGEYQENLFRIVEGYDPEIEHVGSWHSHHCNGYPELSEGDIRGYINNVNHKDYNLDWFFVLLVTQVRGQQIQAKYYAFHRGDRNHYSISGEHIRTVNSVHLYDNVLREAELATLSHRKQGRKEIRIESKSNLVEEKLLSIRAEDKAWFNQRFPSAHVVRNNRDNSLSWKWSLLIDRETMGLIYTYPLSSSKKLGKASFKIEFRREQIADFELDLDELRFHKIEKYLEETKKRLHKDFEA